MDTVDTPPNGRMLLVTGRVGTLGVIQEVFATHINGDWFGAVGEVITGVSGWREIPEQSPAILDQNTAMHM